MASPMVDEQGQAAAYRLVHGSHARCRPLRIESLEIKVVGSNDWLIALLRRFVSNTE